MVDSRRGQFLEQNFLEFSRICRSSPYHAYKGDLSLPIRIILIPLIIGLTVHFATGLLSFPFQVSIYILSTYLKNVGLFLPHASLLQVALTVVKLTDWLFLRISKSTYSETVFALYCCPWKKKRMEFSPLLHLNSIKSRLRKQPTFRNPGTTGYLAKWRLGNKYRNFILMNRWVTTQIWKVVMIGWSKFPTRHDQSEALPRSG